MTSSEKHEPLWRRFAMAPFEKLVLRALGVLLYHVAHPNWDQIDSRKNESINHLLDEIDAEIRDM